MIRQRLSAEVFQAVFDLVLDGLRSHGLLRGRNLGIDSSVMEANASLRGLESRNTGEAYWEYVKRLAAEAGVEVRDAAAVRRFDRQRPGRRTSNAEWVNPHDPEAKVAQARDGATDMLYKSQNVVDLDTGAVLHAEVRAADQGDTEGLAECIVATAALIGAVREECLEKREKPAPARTETMTADKGYFSVSELATIQAWGIKTVVSDPISNRRLDKLEAAGREAVRRTHRSARSQYEKALLRRRGMHIECSFAHILDQGGMRRATLRGQEKLDKRYKIAAATYNLSQLMRRLFGLGTPKQAAARLIGGCIHPLCRFLSRVCAFFGLAARFLRTYRHRPSFPGHASENCAAAQITRFSTGC